MSDDISDSDGDEPTSSDNIGVNNISSRSMLSLMTPTRSESETDLE